MRLWIAAGLILATAAACGSGGSSQTAGSCAAPRLSVRPATARPGRSVHVFGVGYSANCPDTVVNGTAQPFVPLTGMEIDVFQRDRVWTVATGVDAAGNGTAFDREVSLPATLTPGQATVQAVGHGSPATITIRG